MPDHPPVLEYRGPASGGARSAWRVAGGVLCVLAALPMLVIAAVGGVVLFAAGTAKPFRWEPTGIALLAMGIGILFALEAIHGACVLFRPVKSSEEPSADDSVESAEDTDV